MLVAMLFALTPVAVVAIAAVIAVAAVAAAVDHCTNGTRVVLEWLAHNHQFLQRNAATRHVPDTRVT